MDGRIKVRRLMNARELKPNVETDYAHNSGTICWYRNILVTSLEANKKVTIEPVESHVQKKQADKIKKL